MQRTAVRSLLVLAAVSPACATHTREARATLPRSATPPPLAVYSRSVHLPSEYQLENSAILTVTGDRVTVELRGVQWAEEVADPESWSVRVVDGDGTSYAPTARLDAKRERLVIEWGRGPAPMPCTPTSVRPLQRVIPALDVYQGTARYEFDYPGLASAGILTVVVERADGELRYGWRFADGELRVANYGRSPADEQCEPLIVPGEVARVAGK